MWVCANCGEESEDNFPVCWNCQHTRGGSPPAVMDEGDETGERNLGLRRIRSSSAVVPGDGRGKTRYLVVPFTPEVADGRVSSEGAESVAEQLRALLNRHAADGWEFHSIQTVTTRVAPGCLAGLFGDSGPSSVAFQQIVFHRRELPTPIPHE
jgi:hypothetical protein